MSTVVTHGLNGAFFITKGLQFGAAIAQGGGTSRKLKRRKTIRFSDFAARQDYERALADAVAQVGIVPLRQNIAADSPQQQAAVSLDAQIIHDAAIHALAAQIALEQEQKEAGDEEETARIILMVLH